MKRTIYLTVLGFANDRLYLEKPTGEQVAITLDQLEPDDMLTIEKMLTSGVKNWNDSGPAPVQLVADVDVDEETGKYLDLAIMGLHMKND